MESSLDQLLDLGPRPLAALLPFPNTHFVKERRQCINDGSGCLAVLLEVGALVEHERAEGRRQQRRELALQDLGLLGTDLKLDGTELVLRHKLGR